MVVGSQPVLSPLAQLLTGAVLMCVGPACIFTRHQLVDILTLLVPWADTAWFHIRGAQSTFAFGVILFLAGTLTAVTAVTRL